MTGPNGAQATDQELRLLDALAGMALQHLRSDGSGGIKEGDLDHGFMSAGEDALEVLADWGLVTYVPGHRAGQWTEKGNKFLSWPQN